MRARLEALLKANAAPRCGARSNGLGKPCRGEAMPNGRCELHAGRADQEGSGECWEARRSQDRGAVGVDPGTVQRINRPRPFADGAASVVV
jgi:hypothetical protein